MPDSEDSTRQRVAASILRHGPSTVAQLAERLNLTPAAIRRHTSALLEAGHLEERQVSVSKERGRGRPARMLALTVAGREAFDHRYDDIAIQALDFLFSQGGDQAIKDFAAARVRIVEEEFLRLTEQHAELSPADALVIALTQAGYVASAEPSPSGEQVCQHHCPVAHVAQRYPQLCAAETEAFSRVLGSHVQRIATIAHGDHVCTTNIPSPQPDCNKGE